MEVFPVRTFRRTRNLLVLPAGAWRAYGQFRLGEPGDPQDIVREAFGDSRVQIIARFPTEFGTYRWRLAHDGGILEWKRSPIALPAVQTFAAGFVESLANDRCIEDADSFVRDLFDTTIDSIPAGPLRQTNKAWPQRGGRSRHR